MSAAIAKLLKRLAPTQNEQARLLGVSRTAIYYWSIGRNKMSRPVRMLLEELVRLKETTP